MSHSDSASIEFLGFLADIYDPGTGVVSQARLACWLGLREVELEARWQQSARVDWGRFANEVLEVLDVMHDRTRSLPMTLAWYRHAPAGSADLATADYLVSSGNVVEAIRRIRAGQVPNVERPSDWEAEYDWMQCRGQMLGFRSAGG